MSESRSFEQLAQDLDRLEVITEQWSPEQRATATALRTTVEALQKEAFRRLIKTVKETGGIDGLAAAVQDDWVRAVLSFHGLLRKPDPTPEEIVEGALESVRPMLASHGGNVFLVAVVSPEEVQIKLEGSCDGCTHSDITVRQGIETAIKEALPTVERVKVVNQRASDALVQLGGIDKSPFAANWVDAAAEGEVLEGAVHAVELESTSILLTLHDGQPKAFRNACTHLGMPLDEGEVAEGVITCPFHGFQFLLKSGECLTAPQVQLPSYPAKLEDGRVWVQVSA